METSSSTWIRRTLCTIGDDTSRPRMQTRVNLNEGKSAKVEKEGINDSNSCLVKLSFAQTNYNFV